MTDAQLQYLERYADPDAALAGDLEGEYDHVLVVPAFRERADLLDGYREAIGAARVLVVLVVNAPDDAPADAVEENAALLADVERVCTAVRRVGAAAWVGDADGFDLLVIDRSSGERRLPRQHGVGGARKVGCDVALKLRVSGGVRSEWIHTTDADCTLPEDYFEASGAERTAAALTYPFWHTPSGDPVLDRATSLYEISLRYYVLGLAWARSPYAFHTLGSALAVRASTYAAVRGFPRREAAEDFYLLDKARKLGAVVRPDSMPIRIAARRSGRVPFGTGPAVARIVDRQPMDDYELYAPACFELLAAWLAFIDDVVEAAPGSPRRSLDALPSPLAEVLRAMDADRALASAAAETSSRDALRRRLHGWFGAFRTLRLVHALRDREHPSRPWKESLSQAPFNADLSAWLDAPLIEIRAALSAEEDAIRPVGI